MAFLQLLTAIFYNALALPSQTVAHRIRALQKSLPRNQGRSMTALTWVIIISGAIIGLSLFFYFRHIRKERKEKAARNRKASARPKPVLRRRRMAAPRSRPGPGNKKAPPEKAGLGKSGGG